MSVVVVVLSAAKDPFAAKAGEQVLRVWLRTTTKQ